MTGCFVSQSSSPPGAPRMLGTVQGCRESRVAIVGRVGAGPAPEEPCLFRGPGVGWGGLLGKDVLKRLQWLVMETGGVLLPSVCEGGINFVQMTPEGQKVPRGIGPEGRGSRRPLTAESQGTSFFHSSHTGQGLGGISSFTDRSRNSVSLMTILTLTCLLCHVHPQTCDE